MAKLDTDSVYVACTCPVCPGICDVYFMRCATSGLIFYACPACGCAWADPPPPDALDELNTPLDFAEAAFSHATRNQLREAGLASEILRVDTPLEAEMFEGHDGFARAHPSDAV